MSSDFYKRTEFWLVSLFLGLFVLTLIGFTQSAESRKAFNPDDELLTVDVSPIRYRTNVFDTVYTEKKAIIEVLLDKQRVLLRKKGKETDTLLCSTGNEFIKDAVKTNQGIFIVKNKLPVLISKQFNNTKCINWVGFNFGIGFHALETRGYYWSLGKRPSSHGCVRLSQEGAEKLFKEVELETPVIVHRSDNARVIEFLPEGITVDTSYSRRELNQILKQKISLLYKGNYYSRKYPFIVLSHKFIGHGGIDIGERVKVPSVQNVSPLSDIMFCYPLASDRTIRKLFIPDTTYFQNRDSSEINI